MRTVIQNETGPLFEGQRAAPPTALALGFFDGVHPGHAAVIRSAVKNARQNGLRAAAVTFCGNPKRTGLLMEPERKREAVAALGVDLLVELRFERVKDLAPETFVRDVLVRQLGLRAAFCGFNYRFGRGAAGDGALLRTLCARFGASATLLPPVCLHGGPVSSTRIRRALEQGRPEEAALLLGRPFSLDAPVEHGKQLGRTLGFPTVNQFPFEGMAQPRQGVYAAQIEFERQDGGWEPPRPAVTNVGSNPTVGGSRLLWESFLPGFSGILYGRRVRVSLLRFLRPETRFETLEALRRQMQRDIRDSLTVPQTK